MMIRTVEHRDRAGIGSVLGDCIGEAAPRRPVSRSRPGDDGATVSCWSNIVGCWADWSVRSPVMAMDRVAEGVLWMVNRVG